MDNPLPARLLLYRFAAGTCLLCLTPALAVMYILVKLDSPGPFLFRQKRAGKGKKPFIMYKIRTMVVGAEEMKGKLARKNEADGPVFKIYNDPRYTRAGRFLSHTALDEIPQLWNVVRGEMSLVGPRPLPVGEAGLIPRRFEARFRVLPGMSSDWIVKGAHALSFEEWMRLDTAYARNPSFFKDMAILLQTLAAVLLMLLRNI